MWFVPAEIAGTALVAIAVPSFYTLATANRQLTAYQDEDGEATAESFRAFARSRCSYLAGISSVAGLLCSVLLEEPVSVWAVLLLQAFSLSVEQSPAKRFNLAVFAFIASGLPILVSIGYLEDAGNAKVRLLAILQIVSAVTRGLGCLLLPRRPDVYRDGKLVNRERTVSLLTKHTFGWATDQLRLIASAGPAFNADSLPQLSSLYQSKHQAAVLERTLAVQGTLRETLLKIYRGPLVIQALLIALSSALESAPQVALYMVLRSLENQQSGEPGHQPWVWVLALGASKLLSPTVSSWVKWMNQGGLCIPLNAGLTSVIFSKALRRKDVKSTTKGGDDDHKQDIMNHISVDLGIIDGFIGYTYLIPASFLKLVFALIFLTRLIGWKSLLSAMIISVLLIPINARLIKNYGSLQRGLMKSRDRRMAAIREAIQSIRYVKFAALEEYWKTRICKRREEELSQIRSSFLYNALLFSIFWIISPLLLSSVSLAVYTLEYGSSSLAASVAFTTVSVLDSLELSLAILPELFTQGVQANISSSRIDRYLKTAERIPNVSAGSHIEFTDATISWPSEQPKSQSNADRFALYNVNLKFPSNKLSVISGKTGSGKSLVLAAILGECELVSGYITKPHHDPKHDAEPPVGDISDWIIPSAIAYVSQVPWIENASIRQNILFGLPYHEERYQNVLEVCALFPDLATLSDFDNTEVGPNGVNLSGGQRWRISFARALYSRAGILVLDDIFSALDAHTGRYVYENALSGDLAKDRTRILATHQVLPHADYFVHVGNDTAKPVDRPRDVVHAMFLGPAQDSPAISKLKTVAPLEGPEEGDAEHKKPRKFVANEEKETGQTRLSVYAEYIRKGGLLSWTMVFVLYGSYTGLVLGRSWWIKLWTTNSPAAQSVDLNKNPSSRIESPVASYLIIYAVLSGLAGAIGVWRYFVLMLTTLKASRQLFNDLTHSIINAPLKWLDTVPSGRIVNRFSSDLSRVDSRISLDAGFYIGSAFDLLAILVAGTLVSPSIVLFGILILFYSSKLSSIHAVGSRELQRLESISKSPISELFGSTLGGLATLRAYGRTGLYIQRLHDYLDRRSQLSYHLLLFKHWLDFRMTLTGTLFAMSAAILVISTNTSASLAGFTLTFTLQYSQKITSFLRQGVNIDLNINAAERVLEYSAIPPEEEPDAGIPAPAAWPTKGQIEVQNLVLSYASDLPPTLDGISFSIRPNEKIGIVGRTGAGKSSLALALIRCLEGPSQGTISIDGVDISKIKLHDLRSRIALIPQDPVLFSGTVRSNLDPFNRFGEEDLQGALQRAQLSEHSAWRGENHQAHAATTFDTAIHNSSTITLDTPISEGGLNLSQGQRQLLCLARAILSRPRIMILDETTSAVDTQADALIQKLLRTEFQDTTVIFIAHRLATVAECDRILFMDAGRIVEFGAPEELLRIEGGHFRNLVDSRIA